MIDVLNSSYSKDAVFIELLTSVRSWARLARFKELGLVDSLQLQGSLWLISFNMEGRGTLQLFPRDYWLEYRAIHETCKERRDLSMYIVSIK